MSDALVINEIYLSLQGESTFAGLPCVFVRLTACNLRCSYCDTAYAFTAGTKWRVDEVVVRVRELAAPFAAADVRNRAAAGTTEVAYVFSAPTALPLPVRNERGEGRGEGDPTADNPAHLHTRRPSSPQPSPPSEGGEGEEPRALNTYEVAAGLAAPAKAGTPYASPPPYVGGYGPSHVGGYGLPLVELTGGEPLLQANCLPLMKQLCDDGFTVLIETSGAHDISAIDPRVRRIMDLKCPSSGEVLRNRWSNLDYLKATDEVKFVIGTVEDYEWAKQQIAAHRLAAICPLLFSWVAPLTPEQQDKSLKKVPPGQTPLTRQELSERLIADALPVRFQVQLHKVIWPPDQRGV